MPKTFEGFALQNSAAWHPDYRKNGFCHRWRRFSKPLILLEKRLLHRYRMHWHPKLTRLGRNAGVTPL
jgi:hypothetical protein